jgi:sugar phosphate isomerase/epimerase
MMRISRRRLLGSSAAAAIGVRALGDRKLLAAAKQTSGRQGKLNLGFMVWRIGKILEVDAQVAWIAQAGFDSISFHASPGVPGKWRGIDPAAAGPQERRRVRHMLSRFAMREIHAPFDAELRSETPPEVLTKLEEVLRFAGDVGVSVVTVHANPPPLDGGKATAAWQRALDRLDAAAANADTRIGIEFFAGFEWLRRPRRERIGATLDVGHMYLRDGAGLRPYGTIDNQIRTLGDTLIHVHIHDYDGKHDHIEIGTGRVDVDAVLSGLREIDYQGALCLELNPDRVSPEGIRRSMHYLRRRAGNLRLELKNRKESWDGQT